MTKIVLSYRRGDSLTITSWLYEKLVDRYGKEAVFQDIDSIQPTENFRKRIGRALRDSDFVLAVIGPNWVGRDAAGQSRINAVNDWVRVEVETALQLDIPVLPVLVENAEMPQPDDLPASLREITEINALPVSSAGSRFYEDVTRLFETIEKITGAEPVAADPASAAGVPVTTSAPPVRTSAWPPGPAAGWMALFVIAPPALTALFWIALLQLDRYGLLYLRDQAVSWAALLMVLVAGAGFAQRRWTRAAVSFAAVVGVLCGVASLLALWIGGYADSIQSHLATAVLSALGGGIVAAVAGFSLGGIVKDRDPIA